MIDPPLPASIIGGTAALMVFHSPVRLMSRVSCHCWAEISHSRPQLSTPAFATTMSRRPNCSSASATTRCCPVASRTSTSSARILRPSPSTRLTVSERSSGVAGGYPLWSVTGAHASIATMSAPARANRMQCERPCPRAAPVTYATLPASGASGFVMPTSPSEVVRTAHERAAWRTRNRTTVTGGGNVFWPGVVWGGWGRPLGLGSVVDDLLLGVDEIAVQTSVAVDDVGLNRLAVATHSLVPAVERVLADLDDLDAAAAGLVDHPYRVFGHRLVVVHPRETDEAGRPDDLPPVGQAWMRSAGITAHPVGAIELGEVEAVGAQDRFRPVGLRIGPELVAGGRHDQIGLAFHAVGGAYPVAGDSLDRGGDQRGVGIVQRLEERAGNDGAFGEDSNAGDKRLSVGRVVDRRAK